MQQAQNITDFARGLSALNHDSATLAKLNEYLQYGLKEQSEWSKLSSKQLQEQFGKFASCLVENYKKSGKPKLGTAQNYLSSLKQIMRKEVPNTAQIAFMDDEWYGQVRLLTRKKYVEAASKEGWKLVESPDPMTNVIKVKFAKYSFSKNEVKNFHDHAFLEIMWHLFGSAF
jgi:hypothetical protein